MLDPVEHLATRLAEAGDPRLASVEETEKTFAIDWQGHYEIMGLAFVFNDNESGRVTTILGYPTRHIVERIADAVRRTLSPSHSLRRLPSSRSTRWRSSQTETGRDPTLNE
jgi:hypothetical protein